MPELKPSTQLAGVTNLSLLATVKDGLVKHSFPRISHVKRLESVLNVLNALRLGQRETLREPAALPDLIGRLETIHEFRFTLVPPAPGSADRRTRFLLSVTFDGGWEPYMRFIWRDLGTLLDLMFCHCEDYPLAFSHSYAEYIAWVRRYEIAGKDSAAFYYVDAPVTVGDQRRLPSGTPVLLPLPSVQQRALAAIKPIAALFQMNPLFTGPEAGILLRAAHDIVLDVRKGDVTQKGLPPGHPLRATPVGPALAWFESQPVAQRAMHPPERGALNPADLQGGILTPYPRLTDGVLLLLRVSDPAKASKTLRDMAGTGWHGVQITPEHASPADDLYCNVALTYGGLKALGEPDARLALFPQEFAQGMEARCGLLGDVRGNHPSAWLRPRRYVPGGKSADRIEFALVHVVVQLRGSFAQRRFDADGVHSDFAAISARLVQDSGFELLAREAMARQPRPPGHPAPADALVDHLGFADGLSQPQLDAQRPAAQQWNDEVHPGEIFLGHPNDRGDGPYPDLRDTLLDHGSFLVVRKLRQHVGTMLQQVKKQATALKITSDDLLEAMIGRKKSGDALAGPPGVGGPNDFNYTADPGGATCPLQSHARRANPRDGTQARPAGGLHPVPRMLRRGMGFGTHVDEQLPDDNERGIYFMAYVGSIAEQFEVVQRWLSGGNSTGLLSTDADPLLGVPQQGRAREFGCRAGGRDVRIDLGPDAFVSLQWGLYLFAPSLPALRGIGLPPPAAAVVPAPPPSAPSEFDQWQARLESFDLNERTQAWAQVRGCPHGVQATAYGVLAASPQAVYEVLRNQSGTVSVEGYGTRMRASLGLNHLGIDAPRHTKVSPGVNQALAQVIDEPRAFKEAYETATALIAGWLPIETDPSTGLRTSTIDTAVLVDLLLGKLSTAWFDLPDGKHLALGSWRADFDAPARCPGDLLSASRNVFLPHPSDDVQEFGRRHGEGLKQATLAYLKEHGRFKAPVSAAVEAAVRARTGSTHSAAEDAEVADTVIGSIFGFTPVVYGNARTVIGLWLRETAFWELQLALAGVPADATPAQKADGVVRPALVATMVKSPVPEMVWRTATRNHDLGGTHVDAGATVVVGLLPASQAANSSGARDEFLMFGGHYGEAGAPIHACPGYGMAMGVLKALMLALLEAGTIRRTPATGVIVLERR